VKIRILIILAALFAIHDARAFEPGEYPLLDLARELEKERKPTLRGVPDAPALRTAEHAMEQARPPTGPDCAHSLGAATFAGLYSDLARARAAVGDITGAAEAYRQAHACRPRDASYLRAIAEMKFDARDYEGSRAAAQQAMAIEPRDVFSHRVLANIDFVEEKWADAVAHYRYVASSDPDRNRAAYGQIMFWLAQKRAGVPNPEFIARRPGKGWPQPLVDYLRGEYSEAELVMPVRDGDDDYNSQPHTSTDERLCEALFYVGQAHWAEGRPEVARAYFAALVNLRVIYFIEHGMALAEIAKMNQTASRQGRRDVR
jgi:lipoprotein NlpI